MKQRCNGWHTAGGRIMKLRRLLLVAMLASGVHTLAQADNKKETSPPAKADTDWPIFRGNPLQTGVAGAPSSTFTGSSKPRTRSKDQPPSPTALSILARWMEASMLSIWPPENQSGPTKRVRLREGRVFTTARSLSETRMGYSIASMQILARNSGPTTPAAR